MDRLDLLSLRITPVAALGCHTNSKVRFFSSVPPLSQPCCDQKLSIRRVQRAAANRLLQISPMLSASLLGVAALFC
jgi:hypothetical protein